MPYTSSRNLSRLLLQSGEARANAELRRGDIWAGAISNLGNIAGRTLTDLMEYKANEPRLRQEAEARTIGLENARATQATNQRAAEDQAILRSAQSSRLAPDQVKAQLQQLGRGDLIPIFDKTWTDLEASRLQLSELKSKVEATQADYFGSMAAGIKKANFDPMAVEWALKEAEADGHDVSQIKQQLQQNPNALPALVDTLIERSPTQRKLSGEEADRALRIKQAEQVAADRTADNTRADTAAREAARHNTAMEGISRMTAGRQEAAQRETARHNAEMEKIAAQRANNVGANKPPTGVQSRVLNFFNRARQAETDIAQVEDAIAKLDLVGQGRLVMAPNFAQSAEGKLFNQSRRAFTEARLRKDSGAAIPPHEYEADEKTYFVQPGDDAATLAQKKRARAAVLASLAFEAGPALKAFYGDEADPILQSYKDASQAVGSPAGGPVVVQAPDGQTYSFPNAEKADAFKKAAGIR